MGCFTLSNCILEQSELDKKYIADVLMVFTQTNPFKVALDKSHKIIGLYETIGQTNEFVAYWLSLMSMKPTSFETINIETNDATNDEEIFLKVCSATNNQHKLIVLSHEKWQYYKYDFPKIIIYNKVPVLIFDRDEAIVELNPIVSSTINAFSSVVAANNSSINETKNNSDGKEN
jgi:hypothetical protein